jgi:hypothetical protein
MAAQIGEIDQADRRNVVLGDPLERWPEVCATTAFWLKSNWF